MVNDSVREELQTKIGTGPVRKTEVSQPAAPVLAEAPQPEARPVRTVTTELNRQKTSPTLVGFQTKNPAVPDWRLQLQNAVRSRKAGSEMPTPQPARLAPAVAKALKAEYAEAPKPAEANDRVANALKRIQDSRKTFLPEEEPKAAPAAKTPAQRNYPFNVVSKNADAPIAESEIKAAVNTPPKPRLVAGYQMRRTGYDTNKLPKLNEEFQPISSWDMPVEFSTGASMPARDLYENEAQFEYGDETEAAAAVAVGPEIAVARKIEASPIIRNEVVVESEEDGEDIDDLAPFGTRFSAGLFDLIIAVFVSMVLLSPIAFMGGEWFSISGLLALIGTTSIVMFLYLTSALALCGRTIGMKIFSLELVDADLNEYPTFHQAAVSTAVFLLTLPFGGIGFVTMFFNDENRALHDLFSGTIMVSEF